MERTRALLIISVLIFNSVSKSDAFLLKNFQSKKCFAGNNSTSIEQHIELHEISEENCEKSISDESFTRSVHFAKFIGFPKNNPIVLLGTKDDIARIANQYRASHASNVSKEAVDASNASNESVKSSEELNLQHFLERFYATDDSLSERTNFAEFNEFSSDSMNNLHEILSQFANKFPELRVLDVSNNSLQTFDNVELNLQELVIFNASHNHLDHIPEDFFNGIPNVRHIDQQFNEIIRLSDRITLKLAELKTIDLRNNTDVDIFGSFDSNSKLESIQVLSSRIFFDCGVLKLLEKSILTHVKFYFDGVFNAQCMDDKLKISVENEEIVIRSTDGNRELMRFNQTGFSKFDWIVFGANQLTNVTAILNMLGSSISVLNLRGNFIGTLNTTTFQRFTKLENLYLSRTNLSKIDGNPFENLIHLEVLDISENNLTELKDLTRQTCPKLKLLHISGNRLSCEYISDLKKTQSWDDLKVIGDCNNQTEVDDGLST